MRESEDPYQYYVVALREALSFTKVSKEYITTQLKNELHNLHKNSVGKMKNNNPENKAKTKQKIKFLEVNWQIKYNVLVKVGRICD